MTLQCISYTSAAVGVPSRQDLELLLEEARARNAQETVTGALLYCAGTFHQYIEGPAESLNRVYSSILRDRRHHLIIELLREPIEVLEFPTWSMGYRSPDFQGNTVNDAKLSQILAAQSTGFSGGRYLLNSFWSRATRSR